MTTLTGWLTIANLIILVLGGLGGTFVFRSALARAENDVQERVRDALSAENELLQGRVNRLERDNKRLNRLIELIISTLSKKHRIDIEIDGDIVTVRTQSGTHTARIDSADLTA